MSSRWREENYFRYARTHFALDALDSYAAVPDHPDRLVPSPAKKVPGGWRRGVPAKLGRRGGCGWSRAGVAGDRCAARAPGPAP